MNLRKRLLYELVAAVLSFVPHKNNSPLRKWTTIISFLTWGIVFVLISAGLAETWWAFTMLTFMVAYILGRQHEAEFVRLMGFKKE